MRHCVNAFPDAEDDDGCRHDDKRHETEERLQRVGREGCEIGGETGCRAPEEGIGGGCPRVFKCPSRHDAVVGEDKEAANDAHEAGRKPYGTPYAAATPLKGETLVCVVGVGAGLTPGGKLGDEHWHRDKGYTYYIYQYERRTAVLAGLTRETPYIAKAYRTARGGEDGSHT